MSGCRTGKFDVTKKREFGARGGKEFIREAARKGKKKSTNVRVPFVLFSVSSWMNLSEGGWRTWA